MAVSSTQNKSQLTLQADADCGNDRIDRFLANAFRDDHEPLSRNRIKTLILDHQLSEDGWPCRLTKEHQQDPEIPMWKR